MSCCNLVVPMWFKDVWSRAVTGREAEGLFSCLAVARRKDLVTTTLDIVLHIRCGQAEATDGCPATAICLAAGSQNAI
jgi:hypothetical protein